MSDKKILNIIIICTVLALSAGIVSAESPPNLPVILWGNVNIDGKPAPAGTTITATAGTSPAGATKVLSAGTYGEVANGRLPVSAGTDGAKIDFYVNNIKAIPSISFAYNSNDAGKLIRVDLNAQSPQSGGSGGPSGGTGPSGSSGSDGSTGGLGTVSKKGTTTPTAAQTVASTRESGTKVATETTATSEGAAGPFQFSTILGVFALLVIGAIIVFALKKGGKI